MTPIDFKEANVTLGAPTDMKEGDCLPIKAMRGVDDSGYPFFLEVWQPSEEDIEAIKNGEPIYLKILGNGVPPIVMWTNTE